MNNKTLDLYSLDEYNEATGEYSMICICGAVTVIHPSEMEDAKVSIQCSGCYLHYEIRLNEMDIGIANYYLGKYTDAIQHYLTYLRQNKDNSEVAKTVEFNIFESICTLHDLEPSEDGKKEFVDLFWNLYPESVYDITKRNKETGLLSAVEMENYMRERVHVLKGLCDRVKLEVSK